MKIFFIASIYGKPKYEKIYKKIVQYFEDEGHKVDSNHILGVGATDIRNWNESKDVGFHKKVLDGIKKADIVVAELSFSSMSVGYLMSVAVENNKPTVAFYNGEKEPHLLNTLSQNDKFQLVEYKDISEVKDEIFLLLEYASNQMDTRFNFFISPRIANYLDMVVKKKRTPRAVYLRKLIEDNMEKDSEYSG